MPLQSFTHKHFYTQTRFHTKAFTHKRFDTQTLFHTKNFYTQTLLHTDTFTHRRFYTQTQGCCLASGSLVCIQDSTLRRVHSHFYWHKELAASYNIFGSFRGPCEKILLYGNSTVKLRGRFGIGDGNMITESIR